MKNVLLIDSGTGGVNVLKECFKVVPKCNYLLFCDTKNLPYGTKSKEELIDITQTNLEKIQNFFKFDIVILACNTLTATVLEQMRIRYNEKLFIGTVPAIKPALLEFDARDILVIGTSATLKHNKLVQKYKDSGMQFLALDSLATLIDENLDNLSSLDDFLKQNLKSSFKVIVLGCTHYVSIKKNLKRIFPNVKIFDSANGVARRLESLIDDDTSKTCQVQIFCEDEKMLAKFWWAFYN